MIRVSCTYAQTYCIVKGIIICPKNNGMDWALKSKLTVSSLILKTDCYPL